MDLLYWEILKVLIPHVVEKKKKHIRLIVKNV
jgi:hypothetical protein